MTDSNKLALMANAFYSITTIKTAFAVTLLILACSPCAAQTAQDSNRLDDSQSPLQKQNIKPLGKYPLPSKKAVHPNGWYDAWPKELARIEKLLANEKTSQRIRTMEHWNRFLNYFKMVPDDSSQILAVFMEAYNNDPHYFCAEYAEWVPRLTGGNYAYCLDCYKNELPVMDEIVRLVLASYDQSLIKQLTEIQKLDQKLRSTISPKTVAEERSKILDQQRTLDMANLETIEKIIDQHGYPGRSLVGVNYEKVAFLVIQHSGAEAIGKYLPLMQDAIKKQDLEPSIYPYLFDRFEVSKGRPQHFGTQRKLETNELFPVYEPENVNARRRQYGLPPISITDK
ncbi:MAG: DUF6624 domain-containing protein [Planctomycetota bacterium]